MRQSQAVIAGPHIFVSGQLPADLDGNPTEGTIAEKTAKCCENVKNVLEAAGSSIGRVVKVRILIFCTASLPKFHIAT